MSIPHRESYSPMELYILNSGTMYICSGNTVAEKITRNMVKPPRILRTTIAYAASDAMTMEAAAPTTP